MHVQAFEMCRVGAFNCSHASLTSPEALAALRSLPIDNPALYAELSAGKNTTDGQISLDDIEDTFLDQNEDGSDIPTDVVVAHLMSSSGSVPDGFVIEDGSLVRDGVGEDLEFDEGDDAPPVSESLGRGHRTKTGSRRYGSKWEKH